MNSVFAKRRARLLAMKAIRDNHIPGEKAVTCPKCGQDSDRKTVAGNLSVCPKCGYHFPIGAYYRLSTILDPGSFKELFPRYPAGDPLSFPGYRAKLSAAQHKTGLNEAVVTAAGTIGGIKCVVGVLDSRFFMGSMSAAVGEKITLAIEYAARNRLPLILFAGPRVIQQTIGQTLPEGFQRAEFQMEHGFVDAVVPRDQMRETLIRLLRLHGKGERS